MPPDPLDREPSRRVRAVAFGVLLACMAVPPFARQVLGVETPYLRRWAMFRGLGDGVVVAEFHRVLPDGREERLDRFALLGHARGHEAPEALRRLVGRRATWETARQLCARLGEGADVRVRSREGTLGGWEAGYDGTRNLCGTEPPPRRATAGVDE